MFFSSDETFLVRAQIESKMHHKVVVINRWNKILLIERDSTFKSNVKILSEKISLHDN